MASAEVPSDEVGRQPTRNQADRPAAAIRLRSRRRLSGVRGFSSTGSPLNTDSTISEPKVSELVRSCAVFLQERIVEASRTGDEIRSGEGEFDVFSEVRHPLTRLSKHILIMETSEDGISEFVNSIYEAGSLQPEPVVMAVAYIRRLLTETGLMITRLTYRRLILGCLVLASKVWEDYSVWNCDFADVCPKSSSSSLAELERTLLKLLSYDVSLDSSEYARVYYDLRAASRYGKFKELSPLQESEHDKFTARILKAQKHISSTNIGNPRSSAESQSSDSKKLSLEFQSSDTSDDSSEETF